MEDPAARRAWDTALGQLQLQVTRPNFDTWLRDTVGLVAENGSFTVGTPSEFHSEWLSAKMAPVIAKTLGGIVGHSVDVRFQVIGARSNGHSNGNGSNGHTNGAAPVTPEPPQSLASPRGAVCKLNAAFTFERFVIADHNRLAAAAALSAADQPSKSYNPLFVYGGSGLGKTHLLHAIAHHAGRGKRRVVYTTSEQFTNEFVMAIQHGRQEEFRHTYRSADLLLIDDIQFLVGKERTQEEFFHTFNDLHAGGCQLVLTCDSFPKAVSGLEARLCSRFQWGLIADIQPPDLETRLAILQAKAAEGKVTIPADVAHLIVTRAQDNVRELEGLLNRVTALASLTHSTITQALALEALDPLSAAHSAAPPKPEQVILSVARYFRLSPDTLIGPSRARPIAEARHTAMYLLREDTRLPLKAIGHLFGGRDHSTVIHACKQASTTLNDPKGRQQLAEIRGLIGS